MLKKTVNYTDLDGKAVSEELCFHMTQTELMSIALGLPDEVTGSLSDTTDPNKVDEDAAKKVLAALGGKGVFEFIKELVLKAYGKRVNGTNFRKTEEITEDFKYSLAYDAVVTELLANDKAAADFVNAVIPADIVNKMTTGNVQSLPVNK